MSERDYAAEAREIAAGMSWNVDAIEDDACMFYYGPYNECIGFSYGGAFWDALLYSVRLARQPRGKLSDDGTLVLCDDQDQLQDWRCIIGWHGADGSLPIYCTCPQLRDARQNVPPRPKPSTLPAEVPEGHDLVRIGLYWNNFDETWGDPEILNRDDKAHAVVVTDLPTPYSFEVSGSVEP